MQRWPQTGQVQHRCPKYLFTLTVASVQEIQEVPIPLPNYCLPHSRTVLLWVQEALLHRVVHAQFSLLRSPLSVNVAVLLAPLSSELPGYPNSVAIFSFCLFPHKWYTFPGFITFAQFFLLTALDTFPRLPFYMESVLSLPKFLC